MSWPQHHHTLHIWSIQKHFFDEASFSFATFSLIVSSHVLTTMAPIHFKHHCQSHLQHHYGATSGTTFEHELSLLDVSFHGTNSGTISSASPNKISAHIRHFLCATFPCTILRQNPNKCCHKVQLQSVQPLLCRKLALWQDHFSEASLLLCALPATSVTFSACPSGRKRHSCYVTSFWFPWVTYQTMCMYPLHYFI